MTHFRVISVGLTNFAFAEVLFSEDHGKRLSGKVRWAWIHFWLDWIHWFCFQPLRQTKICIFEKPEKKLKVMKRIFQDHIIITILLHCVISISGQKRWRPWCQNVQMSVNFYVTIGSGRHRLGSPHIISLMGYKVCFTFYHIDLCCISYANCVHHA